MSSIKLAFLGNPNCGKTTLFNAYTGANVKVANWPGVTVEKTLGRTKFKGKTYLLTDLPGVYSFNSYTIEEQVTKDCLSNEDFDAVINILDASHPEKSLYLTLQLLELGKPVVIALNMIDIAEKKGYSFDAKLLSDFLGVPVIKISAKKKQGLTELLEKAQEVSKTKSLEFKSPKDKYSYIEKILSVVLEKHENTESLTDKIDRILTNNIFGLPIFFLIMAMVFFFTFCLGDYIKGFFENWLESFTYFTNETLSAYDVDKMLISLITDGIISGVGGVLTFLPNIAILFLCLAILEDSGYMSRVAYVMDGIMERAGLSGKAFIPMILGFGCTVPAIMATRTLKDRRERIKTILAIPYMSCSAKLPVYVMFSKLFFGKYAFFATYAMYIIGFILAILILLILSKKDKKKNGLIIEFPEYRLPDLKSVIIYVWEKIKDYLLKAGTTIFLASVFLWLILHIGISGFTENVSESVGAIIGKSLVPIMKPLGLGCWQIIVSLIWGIAAKEAVISGMSVLFGIENISSELGMSELFSVLSNSGFTVVSACSMMLFCLLYIPCIASIMTIRRETDSAKITYMALLSELIIAWSLSFIFYQIGRIIF